MAAGAITVRFTTKWPWNPASLVIARCSGSRFFSHVVAIAGDRAYEASMTHGCRATTVDQVMKGVVQYQDMTVWVPDLEKAIAFGEEQSGRGYDFWGALGIPFLASDDWNDTSTWWCSELVFALLMAGGAILLDPAEAHRVTPNDLFQCFHPKLQRVDLRSSGA